VLHALIQVGDSGIDAASRKLDADITDSVTAADAVANALQALAVVPVLQGVVKTTPCPLGHYCPITALASDRYDRCIHAYTQV
jgi:hypothetical protein